MISTSLSSQLRTIQQQNVMKKLDFAQPPSSLLFSTAISRTVDLDLLYTLAMIGYENLKNDVMCPAALVVELLSEQIKGVNRNHMTLEENQQVSRKLKKLMLGLSPFLLSEDCQKLLDYLMRNFSIHVFQGESLALMNIMYFSTPVYRKLLGNINLDTRHLSFLKPLLKGHQKINLQFMIRAFEHDRHLLNVSIDHLNKLTSTERLQQTVNLGYTQDHALKSSTLAFVCKIQLGIFARSPAQHSKDLIKFSFDLLKTSTSEECIEIVLTLLVNVLLKTRVQQNLICSFVSKLITKSYNVTSSSQNLIFNFVLFCWQKYSQLFDSDLIRAILESPLRKHLLRHRSACCAVYLCLTKTFFEGQDCIDVLKELSLPVKEDKLIQNNVPLQQLFYDHLFDVYTAHTNLKSVDSIDQWEHLVKEHFDFEFAEYVNRSKKIVDVKILYKIFNKKQLEVNGKVSMNGLFAKTSPTSSMPIGLTKQTLMVQEQPQSSQQQLLLPNPEVTRGAFDQPSKVKAYLRQLDDQAIRLKLIELVSEYYASETPSITASQKNTIIQKLDQNIYTDEYLMIDVQRGDWVLPLAQIKTSTNLRVLNAVLSAPVQNQDLLQDIVFRDLLKQAICRLGVLSKGDYKNILNIISQFGDNLAKNVTEQNSSNALVVYDVLVFSASQIISVNGILRGKLFRLIIVLIKILTVLLRSKLHLDRLTSLFKNALVLFEERNLYVFFIGFASLISKMKFDSVTLARWKQILIEVYLSDKDLDYGLVKLVSSWGRSIGFCTALVQKNSEFKEDNRNVVPKKMLANLFGLIKPKEKIKLARNIVFIMRYIIMSQEFGEGFIQQIAKYHQHARVQLISQTTNLYRNILSIVTDDPKVSHGLTQMLYDIANLYPVETIVKVITPLLPNMTLYGILLAKLRPHPKFRGKTLNQILAVKPQSISGEWLQIAIMCLDRGCLVSKQFVEALLVQSLPETLVIVAEVSKRQPTLLIPYLSQVIEKIFSTEMAAENRQAIIQTLVQTLKGLLDPYMQQLVQYNVQVSTKFSAKVLQTIANNFQLGSLIETIRLMRPASPSQHINFCVLLRQVCQLGHGSKIQPTLSDCLQNITDSYLDVDSDAQELDHIQSLQAQVYQVLCLKQNQSQLNKVLNNLAIWGEKNTANSLGLPFSLRKIVTVKIFTRLSDTMGDLFLPFHKYLYDSIVVDLNHINAQLQAKNSKSGKRKVEVSQRGVWILQSYVDQCLQYLRSVFVNDTEQSFIDTVRFQKLSKTVAGMFTWDLGNNVDGYLSYVTQRLAPTVISLCEMVKDDYKLKTLNADILEKLSLSNSLVNNGVFLYLNEEVTKVGERNLVLFNDLLPYLSEYREARDKDVRSLCRKLIAQIEQMSGEKIDHYFRK